MTSLALTSLGITSETTAACILLTCGFLKRLSTASSSSEGVSSVSPMYTMYTGIIASSTLLIMPSSDPSSSSTDLCVDPSTLSPKRISGRKKFKETRHPVYKGIRQRKGAKWVCEMRLNNSKFKSRLWLGTHISPVMAARAYDIAALALKGKSAQLNFPDSAWLLTRAKSSSVKDIQSAALVAARSYHPATSKSSSTSTCVMLPRIKRTNTLLDNSATMFFDEEAIFNMPCLLANMAEGMLLAPPSIQQQESSWEYMYIDYDMGLSLWSV